jgi:hypothetical protein
MPKTLEQQLGLKHGVGKFTMTDVQTNGKVKVGFGADGDFKTFEIDKETAIMVLAAFEGGKEWMREELRILLNVQEKTWRSG